MPDLILPDLAGQACHGGATLSEHMADPVAHILVDTVATAVLFFAGKLMTELYLGYRSIASFYGGASSLVIFRMWVYDAAQILYVGADVTKAYAKHRGRKITPSEALDGT